MYLEHQRGTLQYNLGLIVSCQRWAYGFTDKVLMWRRWGRLLCCSLSLLALGGVCPNDLQAQNRRKPRPIATPRIDPVELLDSLQIQYKDYRIADARKTLGTLEKGGNDSTLSETLLLYRQRLERLERMLPKVEGLPLYDVHQCTWGELNAILSQYSTHLAKTLDFRVDADGTYQLVQSLDREGYLSRFVSYGKPRNLVLEEEKHIQTDASQPYMGLNTTYNEGFPFLLSDGIHLIYASDKPEGLGGYDLYMSRYSIERQAYLEPILLPMPLNSYANDYLYAIDEEAGRSYLISDRDAEEGKVNLYVFGSISQSVLPKTELSPTERDVEQKSLDELKDLALLRYKVIATPANDVLRETSEGQTAFYFPLTRDIVLRHWEDFRNQAAREAYQNYLEGQRILQDLELQQYRLSQQVKQSSNGVQGSRETLFRLYEQIKEQRKRQQVLLLRAKNLEIEQHKH